MLMQMIRLMRSQKKCLRQLFKQKSSNIVPHSQLSSLVSKDQEGSNTETKNHRMRGDFLYVLYAIYEASVIVFSLILSLLLRHWIRSRFSNSDPSLSR
jgi:hypothetical protein